MCVCVCVCVCVHACACHIDTYDISSNCHDCFGPHDEKSALVGIHRLFTHSNGEVLTIQKNGNFSSVVEAVQTEFNSVVERCIVVSLVLVTDQFLSIQ